jgi:surface protein
MVALFGFCELFNQSVANFDTSKVTNMWLMLNTYGSFNQSLANFDLSGLDSTGSLDAICANTVIDTANYDATLISWAGQLPLAYAFSPHFASAKYSPAAASARADLVSAGWTITDGGPV